MSGTADAVRRSDTGVPSARHAIVRRMDMPEASNVSIMVRIRRTVIEEIHVSVPVTSRPGMGGGVSMRDEDRG